MSHRKQVLRRMTLSELGGADRLYRRATINALPDNALIETFEFYLGKDVPDRVGNHNYDGWQTLVHVCHRWRCIVFASPRRLDLKLYCTRQRSVNSRTLDIWPALPIVIEAWNIQSKEDVTNIIAALRHHNRVCKIDYYNHEEFQDLLLKEFVAIDEPLPVLTSLRLTSWVENVPVLPDSFLGGSAPRLRSLYLYGVPYPSIGILLSSTANLVRLTLWDIPHSGYIAPEKIVPCLSTLSRLGSLEIGFRYPRSPTHRASRHPPPLTRAVFPNLTYLEFRGDIEYLEDILFQIETPMLNHSEFYFFNQLVFDAPLLRHFIHRTEPFMTTHTARVRFHSSAVRVAFSRQEMANDSVETRTLTISCNPLGWQLSALPQVLNSFLSSLSTLETLEIAIDHEGWQDEIDVIQWQEFLHPFSSVKKMTLKDEASVRLVAPALREFARERATEVLPALQNLSLTTSGWSPPGPLKEAIEEFIATRQLYGQPVILHYQDPKK